MTRTTIVLCVLTAVLLVGCEMPFGIGSGGGEDPPRPQLRDEVQVEPGLALRLDAPETVAASDSFNVRFVAENTTGDSIEVQTGACWGQPGAFFGGERVPLVGSKQVCTQRPILHGHESGVTHVAWSPSETASPVRHMTTPCGCGPRAQRPTLSSCAGTKA